ncbi:MAG: hypothetical protein R3C56_19600 [Pirellulaceae bacterium]
MIADFACLRIFMLALSLSFFLAASFATVGWADLVVELDAIQESVKNQQRYRQAQELILSGKLSAASDLLEDIVSEVKDLPHSQLLLAQVLLDNGAAQEAQRVLEILSSRSEDQFEAAWTFCKSRCSRGDGLTAGRMRSAPKRLKCLAVGAVNTEQSWSGNWRF